MSSRLSVSNRARSHRRASGLSNSCSCSGVALGDALLDPSVDFRLDEGDPPCAQMDRLDEFSSFDQSIKMRALIIDALQCAQFVDSE